MSRRSPTKSWREGLQEMVLALAFAGIAAMTTGSADAQSYSSQFLDVLNEACFADQAIVRRNEQPRNRSRVRVILANSRSNDLSQICAYDLTCGEVVFSGRIERSRRVSFSVCTDSRVRGHILLLDPFGTLVEHRNLRSPATIQLGQ